MFRRVRTTIALTGVAALVGIPAWASFSQALEPGVGRAVLAPASTGATNTAATVAMAAADVPNVVPDAATASTVLTADRVVLLDESTLATNHTGGTTTGDGTGTDASTTGGITTAPPVPTDIADPVAAAAGRTNATRTPASGTPATPGTAPIPNPGTANPGTANPGTANPGTAATAAPATAAPATAAPGTAPAPTATVAAPVPTEPLANTAGPIRGATVLPNPGPLSPNQIDRITVDATPTVTRDLLTVTVAFVGAGGGVLQRQTFTIRFVGLQQRSQSFDTTVPNGTVTLSISWASTVAPISVDSLNVAVVGVAPPGSGI